MNDTEKLEEVREHYLADAIKSIQQYGRYWNGSISRTLTSSLSTLLEEAGYEVTVREIAPQWEHVFYLSSDFKDSEKIENIAQQRFDISNNPNNKKVLPI